MSILFQTGCLHETADGPKANNMNSKDMCSQKHVRMKSKIKVVPVCRKWDKRWKQQRRGKNKESERARERERGRKNILKDNGTKQTCSHKEPFTQEICHTTRTPLRNKDLFGKRHLYSLYTRNTHNQDILHKDPVAHCFCLPSSVCPLQQWDHPTEVGMVQNSRPWRPKMLVIFRMSEYPS